MNNANLFSDSDVFSKFALWLNRARTSYEERNINNYNGFTLGTMHRNLVSLRIILLKTFSVKGFVFFTNYQSKKSVDIKDNNKVSMLFYWPTLGRQIRINGLATKIPENESNEYYFSRPYASQVGAWASAQSQALESYEKLIDKYEQYKQLFSKQPITRPPHWGGFNVEPNTIEFWHDKPNRLHLRELYKKASNNSWEKILLNP